MSESAIAKFNFDCGQVLLRQSSVMQMEQFLFSLHLMSTKHDEPICLQQKLCESAYILQNPEQLSRRMWLANAIRAVEDPMCKEYWDYSKANLAILMNEVSPQNVMKMKHVPISFPEKIVQCARDLWQSKPKLYDLSFFGTVTPRRASLLQKLKNAGISVLVIQSFGFTSIIEQSCCSRLILNIHAGDDYTIFESVRCGLFLDAGIPVVSEQSLDNDPRVMSQFVPETLVNVCKRVLGHS